MKEKLVIFFDWISVISLILLMILLFIIIVGGLVVFPTSLVVVPILVYGHGKSLWLWAIPAGIPILWLSAVVFVLSRDSVSKYNRRKRKQDRSISPVR